MTVNLHIARLVVEDNGDGTVRETDLERHVGLELRHLIRVDGLPAHLRESCAKQMASTQNASESNHAMGIGTALYGDFDR